MDSLCALPDPLFPPLFVAHLLIFQALDIKQGKALGVQR